MIDKQAINFDENFIIQNNENNKLTSNEELIKTMVLTEPFAVLCTQGNNSPYGSVISYAVSDNFKNIIFSTPVNTRKYRLINECENVAVVIDNRSTFKNDLSKLSALTITGQAKTVRDENQYLIWKNLLITKHKNLEEFINAPSSDLIQIYNLKYYYVSKFQSVFEWLP